MVSTHYLKPRFPLFNTKKKKKDDKQQENPIDKKKIQVPLNQKINKKQQEEPKKNLKNGS